MKDIAIPQTLIQVDRDILRHCRMCSIGEIFLSQSVCTKEHLHRAVLGEFPYIWPTLNSTFLCICADTYQPDLFHTDLCSVCDLWAGRSSHWWEASLLSQTQKIPGGFPALSEWLIRRNWINGAGSGQSKRWKNGDEIFSWEELFKEQDRGGDPGQGATNSKGFLIFQSMKKSSKASHWLKEICRGSLVKIPCRRYSHNYLWLKLTLTKCNILSSASWMQIHLVFSWRRW